MESGTSCPLIAWRLQTSVEKKLGTTEQPVALMRVQYTILERIQECIQVPMQPIEKMQSTLLAGIDWHVT